MRKWFTQAKEEAKKQVYYLNTIFEEKMSGVEIRRVEKKKMRYPAGRII